MFSKIRTWTLISIICSPISLAAEVVRFAITEREDFADGQSFGETGPYERIVGKVFFAIDPEKSQNNAIVDLAQAPRNKDGLVEFTSDLFILAPKDLSKGNRAILYDVNNRGNKMALRFFNDTPGGNNPKLAGNGFLMRYGFTVVWSGWDGELLPGNARLRLLAPIAKLKQSTSITGLVRYQLMTNDADKTRLDVNGGGHGAYRPTAKGFETATLTWRMRARDPRVPIPRNQFRLHVTDIDSSAPDPLPHVELELPAEFRKGYLYELIYEAQDPLVHGVCFASVRDLISAFKLGAGEANPLVIDKKPAIQFAYGFGVSQSGRFLREMLYSGFNEDEQGKKVFDGLMPHVAGGGLGSFNHRFAQPTTFLTQHQNHDFPSDRFPFAYGTQKDLRSGLIDGILQRAEKAGVLPNVIHTQSSAEYWSRSGSLVHTNTLGTDDVELPDNVRVFAFGGTQHGPGQFPPSRGVGQSLANPGDYRPFLRGLLIALDAWCRRDKPAPASIYPTIRDKTLVAFDQPSTGFPSIPGVRYPEVILEPARLQLGPRWHVSQIIDIQPPKVTGYYKTLVPKCGTDGNELGCLLPPEVAVPLATFTGWNLRSRDAGAENELVGLHGSYIPFAVSKSARDQSGDPRLSVEERYQALDRYVEKLEANCNKLVTRGYLVKEDITKILERQRERAMPLFDKPNK